MCVSKNYYQSYCYQHQVSRYGTAGFIYFVFLFLLLTSPFSFFLPFLQHSTMSQCQMLNANKKNIKKINFCLFELPTSSSSQKRERERDRDHQPPPPTTNLCGERKRMKKMHRHSSSSSSSSISSSSSARTSASASASALTSSTKREFCLLFQRILPSSLASSFVDVCLILYLLLTRICPSYSYHSFQQQRECC